MKKLLGLRNTQEKLEKPLSLPNWFKYNCSNYNWDLETYENKLKMNLTLPVRAEFAFSMASLIVASTEAISALNHFSALWTATRIIKQCFRFGLWISNVQKSSRNVLSRVRHANCNGVHFISLFGLELRYQFSVRDLNIYANYKTVFPIWTLKKSSRNVLSRVSICTANSCAYSEV